jgi:hypothetical protein
MKKQNLYERLKPHHKDQILLELKLYPNITGELIHALTDNYWLIEVKFKYITSLCSICTNMNFNEVYDVFEEPKLIPND